MSVNVEFYSIFNRYTNNQSSAKVEGRTVGECMAELGKQFPELKKLIFDNKGNLLPSFNVYLNGESTYPEKTAKPVKDGDKLNLVLIIQGG